MSVLNNIHSHSDLLKLNEQNREELCREIREFLVANVSKTGGHLASNLGVVELTVAVETVFDTTVDRLVFDVGHQSYVHKLLTDRRAVFNTLRQFGGIAGFPKPSESVTDAFVAGHASSSVSIALGMARARTLSKEKYNVVTVLGDGAATGGMVYEGLNDAAVSNEPMVVILNDNAMSIDNNVGGMASHLSKLRTKEKYLGMKKKYKNFLSHIPGGDFVFRVTRDLKDTIRRMLIPYTIFESMGFTYLGPVDGHDVENLITLLRIAKDMQRPVLLHVMTKKGKGYAPAEEHPKLFHGIGKFDAASGEVAAKKSVTFSDTFGDTLCALAEQNSKVCAITAAMPGGTGLLEFKKKYPKRMFDVGIAEEHAMSMAGGLAKQGMIPVIALYSTFLQRCYDMILQDICMLGLHTVIAVDRAGLVGEDGETHHGIFDVGFLRHAPGMTLLAPACCSQLRSMLQWAVEKQNGPIAIRYPRGGDGAYSGENWNPDMPVICHRNGQKIAILTYGILLNQAIKAADTLKDEDINISVFQLTRLNPLPEEEIKAQLADCKYVYVLEDTCSGSGLYEVIAGQLHKHLPECTFIRKDLGYQYPTHGATDILYAHYGLDGNTIANEIKEVLKDEN